MSHVIHLTRRTQATFFNIVILSMYHWLSLIGLAQTARSIAPNDDPVPLGTGPAVGQCFRLAEIAEDQVEM